MSVTWESIRAQFDLTPDRIHYTLFLLASNPAPVREAIEEYRSRLNEEPLPFLEAENHPLKRAAQDAAGDYLGVNRDEITLTDSTTMGLGLVYNGLILSEEQEVLTTEHDYFSTHASLRLATERTGASMRRITLYDEPADVTEGAMAEMDHIRVHTPLSDELSAGMTCFDIDGLSPVDVQHYLRGEDIMATITPYAAPHARVAPSIVNTPEEVEATLQALRVLA